MASWKGALATPLNPRTFGSLRKTKIILEKLISETLEVPGWWGILEKEREQRDHINQVEDLEEVERI